MPIAHQITLNIWETENNSYNRLNKVNINLFPVKEYLSDFLILNNIKFENTKKIYNINKTLSKIYACSK